MKRLWIKAIAGIFGVGALLYGGAVGYMYLRQTALLYPGAGVVYDVDYSGLGLEETRIRTADGEVLQARLLPPKPGQPVVLFFHGNGGDATGVLLRYRALKAAGVGMFAPIYRGYGASTGMPYEDGLYADAHAAYDALIARGFAPEDIVIHGHSLGSGVAVWLSTQVPSRALILEAPFTATVDVAADIYPWLPVSALMRDRFESRNRIDEIRAPLLIVHGTADETIPFEMGRRLYDMAPPPKRFVPIKGAGHNSLSADGLYDHLLNFIQ